jgi:hypothetical protein
MQRMTNSRLRAYRRCPRLHHYSYNLGIRPAVAHENLSFGTLVHAALEAWWLASAESPEDRLNAALLPLEKEPDPFTRARARVMIYGYHERWIDASDEYETVAVEREFEIPLVNPSTGAESRTFTLAGKVDAIVRKRATGEFYLMEHKTSAEDVSPGSDYWARLVMDSQVSIYIGAAASSEPVQGCLYDVLGKPGQKPLQATPEADRKYTKPTKAEPTPRLYANQRESDETVEEYESRMLEHVASNVDRYYARSTVVRFGSELQAAAADTWHAARMIREAQILDRHPRNPDACHTRGSTCIFFGVCTGTESLDDSRFTRVENVHAELSPRRLPLAPAAE